MPSIPRCSLKLLAATLALSSLSSCRTTQTSASTVKEEPTGDNALHWWGLESIRYDDLPLEAKLKKVPWPGDYWATYRGGISYRWHGPDKISSADYKDYLTEIPTPAQIAALTPEQIDTLSPAEKYDLWQGRTDWKHETKSAMGYQRAFVLSAAKFNNDEKIPSWTGICNGWSLAAMYEDMPTKPVTVESPSNVKITFYPGDIKALMSQIYFDYQPYINIARLGAMCDEAKPATTSAGRVISPQCRDTNPASLHVALGRYLAKGKGFAFDVEPKDEVWNQPVYSYKMTIGTKVAKPANYPDPKNNIVSIVDVSVDLNYIVESDPELTGMSADDLKDYISTKRYHYVLELNDKDFVLGGEWKKGSSIPDFMWRPDELPSDDILKGIPGGYPLSYDLVKSLLKQATSAETPL